MSFALLPPDKISEGNRLLRRLSSALHPPALASCYASVPYYADVRDKIACVVRSVIKNHYFPDGNKRAAFLVFIALCELNNVNVPDKNWGPIFESLPVGGKSVEDIARVLFEQEDLCPELMP